LASASPSAPSKNKKNKTYAKLEFGPPILTIKIREDWRRLVDKKAFLRKSFKKPSEFYGSEGFAFTAH
jgi:hypothetical protein